MGSLYSVYKLSSFPTHRTSWKLFFAGYLGFVIPIVSTPQINAFPMPESFLGMHTMLRGRCCGRCGLQPRLGTRIRGWQCWRLARSHAPTSGRLWEVLDPTSKSFCCGQYLGDFLLYQHQPADIYSHLESRSEIFLVHRCNGHVRAIYIPSCHFVTEATLFPALFLSQSLEHTDFTIPLSTSSAL